MPSPIGVVGSICTQLSCCQRWPRLPVSVAMDDDRPGDTANLVGQCDGLRLGRSTRHQSSEPWPLQRAVLLRVADNGHRADDEQPSQYRLPCLVMLPSLSLPPVDCCFGTSPIHAARLRPDPNAFQSPISATRAVATIGPMPGISSSRRLASHERCQARIRPVDRPDLGSKGAVLPRQHIEYPAGHWRNPAVLGIGNDLKQSAGSIAALRRHDAEFGQMPAYGVAQHRALTHQQLAGPVQHQGGLLLLRLDRNKPHRWPRHRLADRRRIVRIILAALEIGLHVARRHQLHRVAKGLQLAAPVMRRRTGFDADQARFRAPKNSSIFARLIRLRITTAPASSTP